MTSAPYLWSTTAEIVRQAVHAIDIAWNTHDTLPAVDHVQYSFENWNGRRILNFPGTTGLPDILDDLKFWRSKSRVGGVHTGFYEQAVTVRQVVTEARPDLLIGHSLGGAIAQILGQQFDLPVISFGSPAVGDERFARHQDDERVLRVIHVADPVPKVLPWWLGYKHGGRTIKVGRRAGFIWPYNKMYHHTIKYVTAVDSAWWEGRL